MVLAATIQHLLQILHGTCIEVCILCYFKKKANYVPCDMCGVLAYCHCDEVSKTRPGYLNDPAAIRNTTVIITSVSSIGDCHNGQPSGPPYVR